MCYILPNPKLHIYQGTEAAEDAMRKPKLLYLKIQSIDISSFDNAIDDLAAFWILGYLAFNGALQVLIDVFLPYNCSCHRRCYE